MKIFSKTTILTIANATELASGIVSKVMGNEIANTLAGSTITRDALNKIIASRIMLRFSKYTNAKG